MYTEQDLNAVKAQKNKRWLILGIPCLLLFIGLVVSLVIRIEMLTTALTIVIGALLIAGYDLFIKPLRLYQIFINNALHGRTRQTDCYFKSITTGTEAVDGVECRTVFVTEYGDDEKPFERIFYFDALKPFPDFAPEQKIHVVFHDRAVVSIEAV